MNEHPQNLIIAPDIAITTARIFSRPGSAAIRRVNWSGLSALYSKEVRRFFKVQTQTIWAPAITTLLYLVIFTVAMGSRRSDVLGTSFVNFLAPGLIAMAMFLMVIACSMQS